MTHFINGLKVGLTINLTIDGKLYKKSCTDEEQANKFFNAILLSSKNPTNEAVEMLLAHMNTSMRKAKENGLDYDMETGEVFLHGFNTPIPELLVSTIENYHENGFPMESIINFWKLLMVNPDKRVRVSLFDFIQTHDFSLTENGYMVVYKAVESFEEIEDNLISFIGEAVYRVRKDWKASPARYAVYKDLADNTYHITKATTIENWSEVEKNIEYVGNLKTLEKNLTTMSNAKDIVKFLPGRVKNNPSSYNVEKETVYLGVPHKMERRECDSDPATDCSYGLHVGATSYVKSFASSNSVILVCLVNPAHVVAVPNYDHSKMRVSEYFPFGIAQRDSSGNIDSVKQSYFEHDYIDYEVEELERQLEAIENEEQPVYVDCNEAEDERQLVEIKKILETRVVDLQEFV